MTVQMLKLICAIQGSSWALTVERWQSDREKLLGKITAFSVSLEAYLNLAITHTSAIKWKEKYDAVVVDCHHSLRFCGDRT